ncbi:putative oxidoreductase YdhV [Oxobacter pfennigii]|uniref:Putative oxidoreductase YdhV n=1 Tax=Oxobacter pfennigii TaxID=36849 RepID=A0A0P8W9Y9_9CLOT|nr:aldehyde ferredoxin oxidoreductase N-terminal domain-containing protein [Oxobacter pfennigii]KPU44534.1 putative oxidoreductase YdhV [Oxobacter pfennigii]
MEGYKDNILKINLTAKSIYKKKLNKNYIDKYLGGEGYGAALLLDEASYSTHAFSPGNQLSFNTGPLTGSILPSASNLSAAFISPLTNALGICNLKSHIGAEIKFAGYDSLILDGASVKPIYIYINDDYVEIRDAADIWGLDTKETISYLKESLGKEFKIMCIGPAGEKLSRIASIYCDDLFISRGGIGAVMGYKKVKAIAVRGSGCFLIADKRKFLSYSKKVSKLFSGINYSAILEKISSRDLLPFNSLNENNPELMGEPEFEAITSLGLKCGVLSLNDVLTAYYYTVIYGLDPQYTGAAVSCAMEWFEKGILKAPDTDGLDLKFGNGQAMIELVKKIGQREAFGEIFADGAYYAALKLDGNAMDYTPEKNTALLPIYTHESTALALTMVSASLLGLYSLDIINAEISPDILTGLYSAVTGMPMENNELFKKAERTLAIEHIINFKRGFKTKDDYLPIKFLKSPSLLYKGNIIDVDSVLYAYYDSSGYNKENTIPTVDKLKELGMEDVIEKL